MVWHGTEKQGHFEIHGYDDTGGQHYMHDDTTWDVKDLRTGKIIKVFTGKWPDAKTIQDVSFDGDTVVAKDGDGKVLDVFKLPK